MSSVIQGVIVLSEYSFYFLLCIHVIISANIIPAFLIQDTPSPSTTPQTGSGGPGADSTRSSASPHQQTATPPQQPATSNADIQSVFAQQVAAAIRGGSAPGIEP